MYLIGGRRVMVSDLIEAGLIKPGESLRFVRSRMRLTYRAEVLPDGRLQLPDGRAYKSPSRAAMVAAGMRAVDGWHAWVVDSTGTLLDKLRQQFLDRALDRSAQPVDGAEASEISSSQRVHDRLRQARERADRNDPEEISVRDLLSLWGAKGRGDHITSIEADLANHGLVTRPSFRKVTLDSTVSLVTEADPDPETPVRAGAVTPDEDADDDEVGLTVGNLPSADRGVAAMTPGSSIEQALTRMMLDDYSQLAVMSSPTSLNGAVSWQSIARARHLNPQSTLKDALVEAHEVGYDRDLVDVLPELQKNGYLFVRGPRGTISGIVTAADVVGLYGEMAHPFFLIGHLDQSLRRIISRNVPFRTVEHLCNAKGNRRMASFDDLTMGDYQRVFENKDVWSALAWPLDRRFFVERLSEMRQIRNDVMHFSPDPPPPGTLHKLQNIIGLLRMVAE